MGPQLGAFCQITLTSCYYYYYYYYTHLGLQPAGGYYFWSRQIWVFPSVCLSVRPPKWPDLLQAKTSYVPRRSLYRLAACWRSNGRSSSQGRENTEMISFRSQLHRFTLSTVSTVPLFRGRYACCASHCWFSCYYLVRSLLFISHCVILSVCQSVSRITAKVI